MTTFCLWTPTSIKDKLQDKDAKENEASEENLISINRISNLCYITDCLYPSKGDNRLNHVVQPMQLFYICSANLLM